MATPQIVSSRARYVTPEGTPTKDFFMFLTNLLASMGLIPTLGTASQKDIGTSGGKVPLLNAANEWSAAQTFDNSDLVIKGSSAGGTTIHTNASAARTVTIPDTSDIVLVSALNQTITNKVMSSTNNTMDVVQIAGTTGNDAATAGNLGELLSSSVTSGAAVTLTSLTATDITSIALTGGDWDVFGNVVFVPSGSNTITSLAGWASITSSTAPVDTNVGAYFTNNFVITTASAQIIPVGTRPIRSDGTVTAYLGVKPRFGPTMSAYGFLGARRRR